LDAFVDILGRDYVRPASHDDTSEAVRPDWVVEPGTEVEMAQSLEAARRLNRHVLPRGGGTKMTWGQPPPAGGILLSTRRLNRVLEHAAGDMTVTVEAGCAVATLQQVLARQGQRLALDPLWPESATVGGVIATNDGWSLRVGFGSLRDLILGVTVALPDGTLARSGGKVVKNVAGYDLPKLMTGAMGTLGVVTRATFRLHPLPQATRTLTFAARSPHGAQVFVLAVQGEGPPLTGLQVVASSEEPWLVAVRLEGSPAGVHASAVPVGEIAARCGLEPCADAPEPWGEQERVWSSSDAVAKVTFLPAKLAALCEAIDAGRRTLVAQGVGVGLLAVADSYDEGGIQRIARVAQRARELGGSLVVLRGTVQLKERVNGLEMADALPLMRSIKQKFDPTGTLNPGRFGGGI
jgi:glycolate oxidase FAD binding subunit